MGDDVRFKGTTGPIRPFQGGIKDIRQRIDRVTAGHTYAIGTKNKLMSSVTTANADILTTLKSLDLEKGLTINGKKFASDHALKVRKKELSTVESKMKSVGKKAEKLRRQMNVTLNVMTRMRASIDNMMKTNYDPKKLKKLVESYEKASEKLSILENRAKNLADSVKIINDSANKIHKQVATKLNFFKQLGTAIAAYNDFGAIVERRGGLHAKMFTKNDIQNLEESQEQLRKLQDVVAGKKIGEPTEEDMRAMHKISTIFTQARNRMLEREMRSGPIEDNTPRGIY